MSPITLISYTNIELSAARALSLTLDPTKKGCDGISTGAWT